MPEVKHTKKKTLASVCENGKHSAAPAASRVNEPHLFFDAAVRIFAPRTRDAPLHRGRNHRGERDALRAAKKLRACRRYRLGIALWRGRMAI